MHPHEEPRSLSAPTLRATHPAGGPQYELGAENLEIFERDGFLAGIELMTAEAAEELGARVEWIREHARELEPRLYEVEAGWSADPGRVVFHCLGAWLVDEALRDAISLPSITVPAAQALGVRRLRFWHDQIFTKPAQHRGSVPWHQDYAYWTRTEPAAHVTMHIALDDSDEDNGCLHYVPGSHRWGLFDPVPFDGPQDGVRVQLPRELRAAFRPVACPLRRGQGVLHHSHTMHGSPANRSTRPRRALVLNYIADGVRSACDEPLLRGTTAVPRGEELAEPWFPLVLDRDARLAPGEGYTSSQ